MFSLPEMFFPQFLQNWLFLVIQLKWYPLREACPAQGEREKSRVLFNEPSKLYYIACFSFIKALITHFLFYLTLIFFFIY